MQINGRKGVYSYLTIDDIDREKNIPFVYPKKDNGRFAIVEQKNFEKIPGCPIGYWVSENIINSFQYNSIEKEAKVVIGIKTGDNEIFIRNWYEVDNQSTDFICKNLKDFNNSKRNGSHM